jgi:uncharacterized SAM-binding protein YcdF (DUF218 family)
MFLVASRLHIRRAAGAFRARGYDVVPVPSPLAYEERRGAWWRFIPQTSALAVGRDAIYEYVACTYYWWEGWLAPTDA